MAKQIEGVYENVLRCARQEFLEKGFALASLRDIAKAAGTSTGSIYTRFTDKAGLFRALVEPAAGELQRRLLKMIVVNMAVAARPDEITRFEITLLRDHMR